MVGKKRGRVFFFKYFKVASFHTAEPRGLCSSLYMHVGVLSIRVYVFQCIYVNLFERVQTLLTWAIKSLYRCVL